MDEAERPERDEEQEQNRERQQMLDEGYRAIGRYTVEFSRLIFAMRRCIEGRLNPGGPVDVAVPALAMAEATGHQICESFFAICDRVADLDEGEKQVAKWLRRKVRDELKTRNDFAHGDWWVGFKRSGEMSLWRVKAGRKGDIWKRNELLASEMESISDALYQLRHFVAEFGDVCLDPTRQKFIWDQSVRIRDFLRYDPEKKEVVRDGPLSHLGTPQYS